MQPITANQQRSACIVGQGSIGRRHRAVLSAMGLDVTVVSRRPASADPAVRRSVAEAFEREQFDYVLIATETAQHSRDLEALDHCAYQGTVLVEKPLFDQPAAISATRWPHLYVAYQLRFHPLICRLRALLVSRPILSATLYVGQHLDTWRPGRLGRDTYSGSRAAGGGALRDLSHELDLADFLFGRCLAVASVGGRLGDVTGDSDDTWSVVARHARCPAVAITLSYLDRVTQRHLTVVTSDLTLRADLVAGTLSVNGALSTVASDRDEPIRAMHTDVLAGTGEACDLASGLRTVAVIDAIEKAAATRAWVQL